MERSFIVRMSGRVVVVQGADDPNAALKAAGGEEQENYTIETLSKARAAAKLLGAEYVTVGAGR